MSSEVKVVSSVVAALMSSCTYLHFVVSCYGKHGIQVVSRWQELEPLKSRVCFTLIGILITTLLSIQHMDLLRLTRMSELPDAFAMAVAYSIPLCITAQGWTSWRRPAHHAFVAGFVIASFLLIRTVLRRGPPLVSHIAIAIVSAVAVAALVVFIRTLRRKRFVYADAAWLQNACIVCLVALLDLSLVAVIT